MHELYIIDVSVVSMQGRQIDFLFVLNYSRNDFILKVYYKVILMNQITGSFVLVFQIPYALQLKYYFDR